jgi:hypothetical protein
LGKKIKLGNFNQRVDAHVNLITTILKKIVKKKSPKMRDSYEIIAQKIISYFVKIVEFFSVLK